MKNRSRTYGKIRETLPLEGGGKGVGVKGLTDIASRLRKHSTDTERHLWRHLRDRLPLTLTLSPKGRGEITFEKTISDDRRIE